MTGNYYQGNGVFTPLSDIFGNPTSGNTAESVPVASSFVGDVKNFMEKRVFNIPVWVIVLVIVAVIILLVVF